MKQLYLCCNKQQANYKQDFENAEDVSQLQRNIARDVLQRKIRWNNCMRKCLEIIARIAYQSL